MVGQEVDGLACLSDCLLAHTPRVAAVQWEVLPHEHAEFVRGLIELTTRDMGVHAHQIEAGAASVADVGRELTWRRHPEVGPRGSDACSLHVELFTVDLPDPIADIDRAKARAPSAAIADHVVLVEY